ncbi:MAG TPA: hypothetical protein VJ813_09355 [Vicinamibacterales bacterium]|nr:hypothetical protein [Vicinamibacterales bacterium]
MTAATLSSAGRSALDALAGDLRRIFGNRLHSVCAYGPAGSLLSEGGSLTNPESLDTEIRSIALVDRLGFDDLTACLPLARRWSEQGLAVPLILERDEFTRTLDVFPLEYGEIIATHIPVYGDDPFEGIAVAEGDMRRGCELQAKSHLIHLREGFLETGGDPRAVARLITASAEGYRRLLTNIVTLVEPGTTPGEDAELADAAETRIGVPSNVTREVLAGSVSGLSTIADPTALLGRYIGSVERVWEYVDAWKRKG